MSYKLKNVVLFLKVITSLLLERPIIHYDLLIADNVETNYGRQL